MRLKLFDYGRRPAQLGHVQARYNLAKVFLGGVGSIVPQPKKGYQHLLAAAKKDVKEAIYGLASLLWDGLGELSANRNEAVPMVSKGNSTGSQRMRRRYCRPYSK